MVKSSRGLLQVTRRRERGVVSAIFVAKEVRVPLLRLWYTSWTPHPKESAIGV